MRPLATLVAVLLIMTLGFRIARADELVMFEQPGCPYCHAWNNEVGGGYPNTDEGKLLPLRRVELNETRPPDLTQISGVRYTPTFVVMHCGRELDRIVGYAGRDAFWMQMADDVKLVDAAPKCSVTNHPDARPHVKT